MIMLARNRIAVLGLALALAASPGAAKEANAPVWIEAYQSSPADYAVAIPQIPESLPEEVMKRFRITEEMIERFKPRPPVAGTLRSRFAVGAGGSAIRIRLSNEESEIPLVVRAASVALAAGDGFDAVEGTVKELTFAGRPSVTIPPFAPVLSDPVELEIAPSAELLVSVHVPDGLELKPFGGAGMLTGEGNQVLAPRVANGAVVVGRPVASGASVLSGTKIHVIVTLGDSITDGNRVDPTELRGWP